MMTETLLRVLVFAGVFIALAASEYVWPRRMLRVAKWRRWMTNLALVAIAALLVRLMSTLAVPAVAVAAAFYAEHQGLGLLRWAQVTPAVNTVASVVVLDFAIWLQHVASHKIPIFWKLHQVHHADRDIDVSTGLRFHPIEIAASMLWKSICVVALGATPAAVLLFEILLNASAMATHANVHLPPAADRLLRFVFVTPDMHRIHHSVDRSEHDSNYGFNLSIWDRMFATYIERPADGHEYMTIGLRDYATDAPSGLKWSLTLPFGLRDDRSSAANARKIGPDEARN